MKNKAFSEILISLAVAFLAILVLNPFGFWMPSSMAMILVAVFLVVFGIFSGFVWKESPQDERESLHRMIAGRLAFYIGTAVASLGIVVQTLQHRLDPWLVMILVGMILAKLIGLVYGNSKY